MSALKIYKAAVYPQSPDFSNAPGICNGGKSTESQ